MAVGSSGKGCAGGATCRRVLVPSSVHHSSVDWRSCHGYVVQAQGAGGAQHYRREDEVAGAGEVGAASSFPSSSGKLMEGSSSTALRSACSQWLWTSLRSGSVACSRR